MKRFSSSHELASHLVNRVEETVHQAIGRRGLAALAVSGGTTPKLFFEKLAQSDLPWDKVHITLVDDRWVPQSSERSNAKLLLNSLKDRLSLSPEDQQARFWPLVHTDRSACPEEDISKLEGDFSTFPWPLDLAILGMGTDGHTASFFPGGDTLKETLADANPHPFAALQAPGAGEPRVTLTLSRLLISQRIVVHIEGNNKRLVYEKALGLGSVYDMPIRSVLRQMQAPVDVFWSP